MSRISATELLKLAGSNPRRALELVPDGVDMTMPSDEVIVLQAQGVANWHLRNMQDSLDLLAQAEHLADPADLDRIWSIRSDIAGAMSEFGQPEQGLRILDQFDVEQSAGYLSSSVRGRAAHIRGVLYQRMGRAGEATQWYRTSLPLYEQAADTMGFAHVNTNLAILQTHEGNIEEALEYAERAQAAYEDAEHEWWVAATIANRGWMTGCGGNLPRALQLLSEADQLLIDLDGPDGVRLVMRAEVLLRAGLYAAAKEQLIVAVDYFERKGQATDHSEALILAARTAELAGDLQEAARLAQEASAALDAQARPGWAAAARATLFGIQCRAGNAPEGLDGTIDELRRQLVDAGRGSTVDLVVINGAWAHLDRAESGAARQLLSTVDRTSLTGEAVPLIALTEARLHTSAGDDVAALRSLEDGFARLEADLRLLGGIDTAAMAANAVTQIVDVAKGLLATGDNSDAFLSWADRGRQIATWRWPRLEDAELARLLNKARALLSEDSATDDEERLAALDNLREEIKTLRWQQQSETATESPEPESPEPSPLLSATRPTSGGRPLIDVTEANGTWFVTSPSPSTRGEPARPVHHPIDIDPAQLTAAVRLGRVFQSSSPLIQRQLMDQLDSVLGSLDVIMANHLPDDPDVPVLISIDEDLADIPWAALPSLWGRPFSILPTHRYLAERPDRTSTRPGVSVMIGPGLATDGAEADRVAGPMDTPVSVATMGDFDELTEALDRRVVHIAAHGGPEPDNPLFNWLEFDFGRVFLHDLMFLDAVPEIVVLAACYAGQTQRIGAGGTASFANGFLGVGSRWVVSASTALTDDEDLVGFASDVLDRIIDGAEPPVALADARRAVGDRRANQAALAFACFGG